MSRTAKVAHVVFCALGALASCEKATPYPGPGSFAGASGTADAGPRDAVCPDPPNTDDHCGACGQACARTATCDQGVCRPAPETFVTLGPSCAALDIAIEDGVLYWSDAANGAIGSRALTAGAPEVAIAAGEASPSKIIASKGNLYWFNLGTRVLRKRGADKTLSSLVSSLRVIRGFVADGDDLWFTQDTFVMHRPAAGGPAVAVASEARGDLPVVLALDGPRVVIQTLVSGSIDVLTPQAGEPPICGVVDATGALIDSNCLRVDPGSGSSAAGLATLPGRVYWAAMLGIHSSPTDAKGREDVAAAESTPVSSLAVTATSIYFSEPGDASDPLGGGFIHKAALGVQQPSVHIARGQRSPHQLAVSDAHVYWTTAGCTIERAPL